MDRARGRLMTVLFGVGSSDLQTHQTNPTPPVHAHAHAHARAFTRHRLTGCVLDRKDAVRKGTEPTPPRLCDAHAFIRHCSICLCFRKKNLEFRPLWCGVQGHLRPHRARCIPRRRQNHQTPIRRRRLRQLDMGQCKCTCKCKCSAWPGVVLPALPAHIVSGRVLALRACVASRVRVWIGH